MRTGWRVRGGGRSAASASARVPNEQGVRQRAMLERDGKVGRGEGGRERTRVVCSTFARRGKSLTPLSRMVVEEERRALVERREETHAVREVDISCL